MNFSVLALSGTGNVALWLSVAVVIALIAAGTAVFFAKRQCFAAYVKYAVLGLVAYAAVLGLMLLCIYYEQAIAADYDFTIGLSDHYSSSFYGYVIAPAAVLCAVCVAIIAMSCICGRTGKPVSKTAAILLGSAWFAALVLFAAGVALANIYFADAVRHYAAESGEYVYAADISEHVALWVTAPLAILIATYGTSVFFTARERFGIFLKRTLIGAVIYAAVLGIVMLALSFAKHYSVGYAEENWLARDELIKYVLVPLVVLCAAVLCAAAALVCVAKFKPKKFKLSAYICGAILVAILLVAAVMIGLYYSGNISGDGYYDGSDEGSDVNDVALYCLTVALIAVVVAGAFIFGRKDKKGFDTRTIAYAAVCIALSFALSYVRIWKMPQGGSVTFASLLPLMIFSYMFGIKKGVFAGFIYGILQAIQDPWIIHPAQFLLDYPVAFACIGLAGMFAKVKRLDRLPQLKFALGAVVASVFRFIAHVFSGVYAFSAYAIDAGMGAWAYSLMYNSFVFVDIAIVIVAGVMVFSSKNFVKFISRYNVPAEAGPAAAQAESAADKDVQTDSSATE